MGKYMTRHGKMHDNGMAWHGLARHDNDMTWQWHSMTCLSKASYWHGNGIPWNVLTRQ
jgi:hypothetical protein